MMGGAAAIWPGRIAAAVWPTFWRRGPRCMPLPPPLKDELIARVEAVSICSSDVKVLRMGGAHPLFAGGTGPIDSVLGHEVCLRVSEVGEGQSGRFRPGQRIALQPAVPMGGRRLIYGIDLPGGFAQYLRLGPEALAEDVFEVPEYLPAATVALLEPYGCVERAWQPNVRRGLKPGGTALVVSGPGAGVFAMADPPDWRRVVAVGPVPAFLSGRTVEAVAGLEAVAGAFDDILALGDLDAGVLGRLCAMLARDGMLLQGRRGPSPGPVAMDPARVHYDRLSFAGTRADDLATALAPARQRFDVRPGGVALIHGAGGAMGRIHVHRLLQMKDGPGVVIASSRKGQRLADLNADFAPMAARAGRALVVVDPGTVADAVALHAPGGLDDAVVVAPEPQAVAEAAGWLGPDGLLVIFAGFPYGARLEIDLAQVALGGVRLTGSTGCSADNMRQVLARVLDGSMDLTSNIAAVGGLLALPEALQAVAEGEVSGKIVIYPQCPDLPLRRVAGWTAAMERGLTGGGDSDERGDA
jgi:L-sorbose 1-phosphate reductase